MSMVHTGFHALAAPRSLLPPTAAKSSVISSGSIRNLDGRRVVIFPIWIAGVLIVAGGFDPAAAGQPDSVNAIIPGAPGVLTKCRGWVVTSSCRTYHHIDLPSRIAVGDKITVSFGSHPKEFKFFIARIDLKSQHCTLFSKAEGDRHRMDKINVAPCYQADEGR